MKKRSFRFLSASLVLAVMISAGAASCSQAAASKTIQKTAPNYELFTGQVEHIFFHPLIIYPQIAFPKSRKGGYICDWFITLSEFNRIIEELYQRGYVLVSVKDLYEVKGNQTVKKDFYCPKGKKPLIISIDDMNYYTTMQTHGMTKKLVIRDGKIASLAITPSGEKIVENAEVTEVVDSFVAAHPDFSFNGARGMIALTGYNGVYGYETHKLKAPGYAAEKEEAVKITQLLKKNGWEIASHGYRHLQEGHVSAKKLEADAQRWREEVECIVGSTPYHIYPFGDIIKEGEPGLDVLRKYDFRYFFGVSFNSGWKEHGSWVYQHRIPIDGKYMMGIVSGSRNSKFFDIKKNIEPLRVKHFMN